MSRFDARSEAFPHPPPRAVWASHVLAARLVAELARVLGPGRLLAVKGLVTARTLYDDVADRPIADADLRVRPVDLAAVRAAAHALGLEKVSEHRAYGSLLLRGHGLDLDVETVVGAPFMTSLAVEDLFDASGDGAPLGLACRVPSDADHALLLAVNLFKDKLRLGAPWAVEDALRLGARRPLEADAVAARAEAFGMVALVEVVARFLGGRGSAAWAAVAERAARRHRRRAYVASCRGLFAAAPESLAARLLARCSADAPRLRARALVAAVAFSREIRGASSPDGGGVGD